MTDGEHRREQVTLMQIGMIGLGRMGGNIVRRLLLDGHRCVVFDPDSEASAVLAQAGATAATSIANLVDQLAAPRVV